MNEPGTFERLTENSLEEHAQIHFFLEQLRKALADVVPGPSGLEPMRRVAAELEGLVDRLKEHFQREEEGLFRALVDADASCGSEVRRLEGQHERLTEILELARIHAGRGAAADPDLLRQDIEEFVAVLAAHEGAEDALFRRALAG